MSDIHLRSDAILDQLIAECTNSTDVAMVTKKYMADKGIITRNDFGFEVTHPELQAEQTNHSLPASGYKFEHVFNYYPNSGRRSLVLHANTEEELQKLILEMEKTVSR